MSKRKPNAFAYSFDSDSDSEDEQPTNKLIKKPKKLPSFLTDPNYGSINQSEKEDSDSPLDKEDEYMNFRLEMTDNSKPSERSGKHNPLKYNEMQRISREQGLSQSLLYSQTKDAPKSIGLSIMEKMGYKVGTSLGKNQDIIKENHEPIPIMVKSDKLGLGSSLQKTQENKTDINSKVIKEYRQTISSNQDSNKIENAIYKIRRLCFEFSGDSDVFYYDRENFNIMEVNSLWRPYIIDYIKKNEQQSEKSKIVYIANEVPTQSNTKLSQLRNLDEVDDDELYDKEEMLNLLLNYIRTNFYYCWYCGCRYDTYEELEKNCPGITELDHS